MGHMRRLRKGPAWSSGLFKGVVFVCLAVALLLPAGALAQEGSPSLPHAFSGSLVVGGEPAAVGTVVTAVVDGHAYGSVITSHTGKYGSDEEGNFGPGIQKLIVQGNVSNGDVIEFHVGGAAAGQTFEFATGEITELDLSVAGSLPNPTPATALGPGPVAVIPMPSQPVYPESGGGGGAAAPADETNGIATSAVFQVVDLTVTPSEVGPGESVVVVSQVANTGDAPGTYRVTVEVNGAIADWSDVTLSGGDSTAVEFTLWGDAAGEYVVRIADLTGSFAVSERDEGVGSSLTGGIVDGDLAKEGLSPATFTLSDLTLSSATVGTGDTVDCFVTVANTGDLPGKYIVAVEVNGVLADSREVALGGGERETVEFTLREDAAGEYVVEVGDMSSSFAVSGQDRGVSWSLIGGIIGGALAVGLLLALLARRKTRAAEVG